MKRGKLICVLVLLLLVYCGRLFAKPVSAEKAQQAVKGWLKADARPLGAALGQDVRKVDTFNDEQDQVIYYVVYLQPAGFVIVPADDLIEPILAFADNGTYDPSLDNPLGALVNKDVRGRISAGRAMLSDQGAKTQAIQKTTSKWDYLAGIAQQDSGPGVLNGVVTVSDPRVDPLLKTKWSQTTCCNTPALACYNYYTPPSDPCDPCDYLIESLPGSPIPYGNPNNFPCGCVATAMAQLMRFHEYPDDPCGIGKHQFQIWVNGLAENAWTRGGNGNGGPYDFNSMVYEPNCFTTDANILRAIGALCYDAGVSVNMSYNPGASAAVMTNTKTALINTFTYSNVIYKSVPIPPYVPILDLAQMINPNLDYEHPVLLGLVPDHAVVVDGYGYDPNNTMYHHINMGWAGVQDAWYNFYTDMPQGFFWADTCVYNIFVTGAGEIISGRVTDSSSGNAIADAAITAVITGGGTYQAVTNNRGIYVLPHVPSASAFTITAAKPGYNSCSQVINTGTSADVGTIGNRWGANDNADFVLIPSPACYVDVNAVGDNNGSSWDNAYNYLQDALADPNAWVICVAGGTYYPDSNSAEPNGSGDRDSSFVLRNGVSLYGGYAGHGSTDPNARNVKLYKTILSGDLAHNDADVNDPCDLLNDPCRAENSYHVVTSNGTDASAILDGFTVTAGNADTLSVWPTSNGGGILNVDSGCTINNCLFIENSGEMGGAIFNHQSSLHISNCDFVRNGSKYDGGAILNDVSSCATIVNCKFTFNKSGNNGGALFNGRQSNSMVTNCIFIYNSTKRGGGIRNATSSCPTITNCAFRGNLATERCGGISDNNASPIINNCILWDDTAPAGSEINDVSNSVATVNYSDVDGGWGGAGVGNINADPCFADANGPDGVIGTGDDNLRLSSGSPCIDIGDNNSVPADGADLDNDANTIEQTPLDLDLRPRFADGNGDGNNVVDMGAYEFSYTYSGDFDGDCNIDFADYAFLASAWLQNNPALDIAPPPAGDGIVDFKDLIVLCDNWLAGK